MRHPAVVAVLLAAVAAAPARAQEHPRVTLLVDGGRELLESTFSSERTFREFAEDATLRGTSTAGAGPTFGAALQVRLSPRLGILAGMAVADRDQGGAYEARLPHPLYLDRARVAAGEIHGSYRETEVFAALAWLPRSGHLDGRIFAGPSFFASVEGETPTGVRYTHQYPYDEVNVQEVALGAQEGSGIGFTVGAGADLRLHPRLGVGLQVRYRRATVTLGDTGASFDVRAGGLATTVGLRAGF